MSNQRTKERLKVLRLELAIAKYVDDKPNIKAKRLADRIEAEWATSKRLGSLLSKLADEGCVEKWGRSTGISWRILL